VRAPTSAYRLHKGTRQMEKTMKAIRQAKFFVVPTLVIVGWLALFGAALTSVGSPRPLHASIAIVLHN